MEQLKFQVGSVKKKKKSDTINVDVIVMQAGVCLQLAVSPPAGFCELVANVPDKI